MRVNFSPIGFVKEKLIQAMNQNNLDGILVTSPENVMYLTGYPVSPSSGNPVLFQIRNHYPFFAFFKANGESFLVAWEYSMLDIDLGVDHTIPHKNLTTALEKLSALLSNELGTGKFIGIESTCPYLLTTLIRDWVNPSGFFIADAILDQLRLIKSRAELDHVRKSCQIVEKTYKDLFPLIKPGIHRSEVIQSAKAGMVRNGASGIGHCTISFGASNPEVEIDEILENNRLVIVDLGAMYYGYASDNRRMLYTGVIPSEMNTLHKKMCDIVEEISEALIPGAIVEQLCALADRLYIKNGLDPNFTHIGHTMGLQTEEVWLDRTNNMALEPGMLINIELYSMMATGENIGDEETYIVTEGNPERISQLPRSIISI
jgi:Xaa-Pro aminopeptidase